MSVAHRSSICLALLKIIYCGYIGPSHLTPKPKETLCKHSCQCVLLTIISLNAVSWSITVFCVILFSFSNFLSWGKRVLYMPAHQDVCVCAWHVLAYVEGGNYHWQSWWLRSLVPTLRRPSQEDCYKFKARLGYLVSSKPTRVKDPVFKERKRRKEKEIETHQSCLQAHSCIYFLHRANGCSSVDFIAKAR